MVSIISLHCFRKMHLLHTQKGRSSMKHESDTGRLVLAKGLPVLQLSGKALPCGSNQVPQKCTSHENLKRQAQIKCRLNTYTF